MMKHMEIVDLSNKVKKAFYVQMCQRTVQLMPSVSGCWSIVWEPQLDLHWVILVGPDDFDDCRIWPQPWNPVGQNHRWLLRTIWCLHPHSANSTYCLLLLLLLPLQSAAASDRPRYFAEHHKMCLPLSQQGRLCVVLSFTICAILHFFFSPSCRLTLHYSCIQ